MLYPERSVEGVAASTRHLFIGIGHCGSILGLFGLKIRIIKFGHLIKSANDVLKTFKVGVRAKKSFLIYNFYGMARAKQPWR